jgi:hypothetical protein
MYIEMTTFAIPTFLITLLKIAVIAVGVWLVAGAVAMAIYSYITARNIERQLKIDAEIDRLHK